MTSDQYISKIKPKIDQIVVEYDQFNAGIENIYRDYLNSINKSLINEPKVKSPYVPNGTIDLLTQYELIFRQHLLELRQYFDKLSNRLTKSKEILKTQIILEFDDDTNINNMQSEMRKAENIIDNKDIDDIQDSVIEDLEVINELTESNKKRRILLRILSDKLFRQQAPPLSPSKLKNPFKKSLIPPKLNYEEEIEQLKKEIENRRKKLKDKNKQTERLKIDNEKDRQFKDKQLENELEKAQLMNEKLNLCKSLINQIERLEDQNSRMKEDYFNLTQENERLRRENFTAERDRANLEANKKELEIMKRNVARLQKEIDEGESNLQQLRLRVDDLSNKVSQKEKEFNDDESRVKGLEKTMVETDADLVDQIQLHQRTLTSMSDNDLSVEDQSNNNYSDEIVKLLNSDFSRSASEEVLSEKAKVNETIELSPMKQKIETQIKHFTTQTNQTQISVNNYGNAYLDELSSLFN